jgi:hypothetical protein
MTGSNMAISLSSDPVSPSLVRSTVTNLWRRGYIVGAGPGVVMGIDDTIAYMTDF